MLNWLLWTGDQFIGIPLDFISGNYGQFYNLATMVKLVIIQTVRKTWHSEMCERITVLSVLLSVFALFITRKKNIFDHISLNRKSVFPEFVTICKLVGFIVSHWTVMNQQEQIVWGRNCLIEDGWRQQILINAKNDNKILKWIKSWQNM